MFLPSGSKLGLAMECQHAWTSGIAWPTDDDPSRFAFGNAVHKIAEWWEPETDRPLNAEDYSQEIDCTGVDIRRLFAVGAHVEAKLSDLHSHGWLLCREIAVAYHVERGTARILERRSHRDYSDQRPGELTATIDVIAIKEGRVLVADWKTGRPKVADSASWQLVFAALAVARIVGAESVDVALWYVDEQGVWPESYSLDAFDLSGAAEQLKDLWAKLHSGPTAPIPGPHCVDAWCPLTGKCAATRAALAETAASNQFSIATMEDAARVWEMVPLAEAAIEAVKKRIKAMAAREPIPLRNGKRLVIFEQSRESISIDAKTVCMVPPEALSTSKAAIERAIGKESKQLIQELRDAGAVRDPTYRILKEVD